MSVRSGLCSVLIVAGALVSLYGLMMVGPAGVLTFEIIRYLLLGIWLELLGFQIGAKRCE
jgi:hypothetical protein